MLESELSVGVNIDECWVLELFDHLDIVSQHLELGLPDTVAISNELVGDFEGEEPSKKLCVHVLVIS